MLFITCVLLKERTFLYGEIFMRMSRSLRFAVPVVMAVVLSACGTVTSHRYQSIAHPKRPLVERVEFNPAEIKRESSVSHVVGRAYLRDNRTFQERVANFADVVLNPVSTASTQWYNEVCRRGKVLKGDPSPLYQHAMFVSKTNSYGQFTFPNVPTGEYYLSTKLYWMDTAPRSGPVEYGGLLAKKVKLVAGAVSIDLSQQDRCSGYFH